MQPRPISRTSSGPSRRVSMATSLANRGTTIDRMSAVTERPLSASEVFAEAIRLYGARVWAAIGLGLVTAGGIALLLALPVVLRIVVLMVVLTASLAAAARIASGD